MTAIVSPQFTKWEFHLWGTQLRWLSSPNMTVIESLSRSHLHLPADHPLTVSFFAQGGFNKLYSITTSKDDSSPQYIFRATHAVEPFYKTTSEVATLSYLRYHTSIPVPRVIAHSSNAQNELGCEWILMEKLPGVALTDLWKQMDLDTKSRLTKSVVTFVRQLRDLRSFTAIGNLYFREHIPSVRVVPTDHENYVLGPIVNPFMFSGGRKLRVSRNLGPYSNDAEYIDALVSSELEDMKLLLSPDAYLHNDFDEDRAEEAEDAIALLHKFRSISATLFPSQPHHFSLHHHDLSLGNILVDPATYEITGIVDWESVGTRPHWEFPYPEFLRGPDVEEVEPLVPGDQDEYRVERWENWEKTKLRVVFDEEMGAACCPDDGNDELRREFRMQLDWVGISLGIVHKWMNELGERMKPGAPNLESKIL